MPLHSAKLRGPRQESACALTGRGGTTDVLFQRGGGRGGGGSVRSVQAIPKERRRPRELKHRSSQCLKHSTLEGMHIRLDVEGMNIDQPNALLAFAADLAALPCRLVLLRWWCGNRFFPHFATKGGGGMPQFAIVR